MNILIAASPLTGHVNPILSLAKVLIENGHKLVGVCSSTFKENFIDAGVDFIPFPEKIDHDFNNFYDVFPERMNFPAGPERLCYDMKSIFVEPMQEQYNILISTLAQFPAEAIICDSYYMGTLPILLAEEGKYPPVIHLGISVLPLNRDDNAPFGPGLPPAVNAKTKIQYLEIKKTASKYFINPIQDYLNSKLRELNVRTLDIPMLDAMVILPKLYLHPSVRSFEFNIFDVPPSVKFIGVLPLSEKNAVPVELKNKVSHAKTIVLVTQGTVANHDYDQLINPAITALGDRKDILVVVTTGYRSLGALTQPLPDNVYSTPFVCYAWLLPFVSLVVTNGGYGTVSQALVHGIPMVVAGLSEDKAEVGARVAWSGTGINLATSDPSPETIKNAVKSVLDNTSYKFACAKIADDYAKVETKAVMLDLIERTLHR